MKNNQKVFTNLVVIGALVLLFGLISYSAWSNKLSLENSSKSSIKVGKISLPDQKLIQEIQKGFDEGHQPWRGDPKMVAEFSMENINEQLLQNISFDSQKGVAMYLVPVNEKEYKITVIQPVVGEGKIWFVSDIEEYTVADQTSDWKTYTNDKYGFEIKYPKQWFVVKDQSLLLSLSSKDTSGIYKQGNLYVGVRYISDWNEEKVNYATQDMANDFQVNTLQNKLNTEVKINYVGDPPWGTTTILIRKPGTNTGIAIWGDIDTSDSLVYGGHETNKALFKQVLSTFKFKK